MRFRTAAVGLVLVACYSNGEGKPPPLERIYFPTGLAIDKEQKRLYVASSDFDLQYNAGSVQALNLERIREIIPRECQVNADCRSDEFCDSIDATASYFCVSKARKDKEPCGELGVQSAAERRLVPGRCKYVDLIAPADDPSRPLLVDAVGIGAFATDVQLRYAPEPNDGLGRLFIPVRGSASLHWIDLKADGKMACGQTKDSPSCDDGHRVGTDSDENARGERMPNEPYGIAINDEGDAIAITHQTSGKVSLFHQVLERGKDEWTWGPPTLEFVQADLPAQVLGIVNATSPQLVHESRLEWLKDKASSVMDPYPPGFVVTYRNAAQIDLLRFYGDGVSSPTRPYLQLAASVNITALSIGSDSRGIAYDDSERKECETKCPTATSAKDSATEEQRHSCLASCAAMPIGVYVASRLPNSLLVGTTVKDTWATPNRDVPMFFDTVPVPSGASRVYVGKVVGDDGTLETRVFVVCFDQRRIAIYDPKRRRMDGFVTTGRGPHALAFDSAPADPITGMPARALAYVAHFTDSYVGVIELDRRKFRTYSNIVLNLGSAIAPRASK